MYFLCIFLLCICICIRIFICNVIQCNVCHTSYKYVCYTKLHVPGVLKSAHEKGSFLTLPEASRKFQSFFFKQSLRASISVTHGPSQSGSHRIIPLLSPQKGCQRDVVLPKTLSLRQACDVGRDIPPDFAKHEVPFCW